MSNGFNNPYPYFDTPSFGVDFGTGRRDTSAKKYLAAKKLVEEYEDQKNTGFAIPIPSMTTAPSLTPTALNVGDYIQAQKELFPLRMAETAKENLLNVGSGLMFGAASIPFMEFQRNKEFERQQKAFSMKEQSPTAQMERNRLAQEMAGIAASSTASRRNAFANLMRSAVEPLRSRK